MLQNAPAPPSNVHRPARAMPLPWPFRSVLLALLLAGVSGCALFDEYDYYGYDYVYDATPTNAPVAGHGQTPYGHAPHASGRSRCGCSSGSAGVPVPPPPPSSAYQPTGNIVPASASQSREPDLLNR